MHVHLPEAVVSLAGETLGHICKECLVECESLVTIMIDDHLYYVQFGTEPGPHFGEQWIRRADGSEEAILFSYQKPNMSSLLTINEMRELSMGMHDEKARDEEEAQLKNSAVGASSYHVTQYFPTFIRPKWEYHTMALDSRMKDEEFRKTMNDVGEDGWEAVAPAFVSGFRTVWLLKRVRQS